MCNGFKKEVVLLFDNVMGAINGILIWILKPIKMSIKKFANDSFKCWRNDKFGFNIQGICNHVLYIRWINISYHGNASDFMDWTASSLCKKLEKPTKVSGMIRTSMCIVADKVYI